MNRKFVGTSRGSSKKQNIYANKSSLILNWILHEGIEKKYFSIRSVAKQVGVSLGLVQKTFELLVKEGVLTCSGMRTAKIFTLINPGILLENWIQYYNIVKKCKTWTYQTGLDEKGEIIKILQQSELSNDVVLALHSSAEELKLSNTNLRTVELYMLSPSKRKDIESLLYLEPKERGYEVLLIDPYYKDILKRLVSKEGQLLCSPLLLTYLDLYHFPLRGKEQADFILDHSKCLKSILNRK